MKPKVKEGQVWSYKNRISEENSRLTVIKIDDMNNDIIIHIKVDGLKIVERKSGKIIETSIGHLPINLEMFEKSVCEVKSNIKASIDEGYLNWKNAFDSGTAGVWSIEIAAAINMTEETYNS